MQLRHVGPAGLMVLALGIWPAVSPAGTPIGHAAATCADYPNQASAQRAADTRDPDGDGIYCESLPCPCSSASGGSGDTGGDQHTDTNPEGCGARARRNGSCSVRRSTPTSARTSALP